MKHFIGIDIGLKGGMSLINEDSKLIYCIPIPVRDVLVGKSIRPQYEIEKVYKELFDWLQKHEIRKALFERLRAIPNQSSQTGFSMGSGSMMFKTLFTVMEIDFDEVEPYTWQKSIFGKCGISYSGDETKRASVEAAKKLFPGQEFKRTARSRTACDGLTDSALMAIHCKDTIKEV